MRINIKLEYKNGSSKDKDGLLIERITREGNAAYLVKVKNNLDFPNLAEVEVNDYNVFDANDMDALIAELLRVRQEVTDLNDQSHIYDIIRLAKKCKENADTVLIFAG